MPSSFSHCSDASTNNNNTSTTALLALAAFWQSQLDVLVVTAEFFPGGGSYDAAPQPSSLVTVEPFGPGGLRRLALNVHSPLMQHAAHQFLAKGRHDSVGELGRTLLRSGSWPVAGGVDCQRNLVHNVHWNMARGLIATPHANCAWPVPHQEIRTRRRRRNSQPMHTALAVWPRRICGVCYQVNRDSFAAAAGNKRQPELQYVAEVWKRRDEALALEFEHLVQQEKGLPWWRCWSRRRKSRKRRSTTWDDSDLKEVLTPVSALLTYAPSLPVFCLAEVLISHHHHHHPVPRHFALAEAAAFLVRTDRLFALSLFFGVPLMDRTQTLPGALRCAPLARPPPTDRDCREYGLRWQGSRSGSQSSVEEDGNAHDDEKRGHDALRTAMLKRARTLWERTEQTAISSSIYVGWSGGIDSTAALVALLETATASRRQRLKVVLDEESMVENPTFYRNFIGGGKLEEVPRQGQPLSWHEHRIRRENAANVFVTGELGDQLFGSDRCKAAFPEVDGEREELPPGLDAPQVPPPEYQGVFVEKGLGAPWEETILPSLDSVGLIAEGGFRAWRAWIAPQLALAPFPIVSTYDFLWWLNFSMKWQNVSLRCLHDGGVPLLSHAKDVASLTGCVHHFYDDFELECWSCVQNFHRLKFPDLSDWTTYKEPLKYFIKQFDNDETYYREKTKVASLCFGAPTEADSYVNRFHGAVVDLVAPSEQPVVGYGYSSSGEGQTVRASEKIDPDSRPMLLTLGVCGLSSPDSRELAHLVHAKTLSALSGYPNGVSNFEYVNPWDDSLLDPTSPFNIAPFFAEEDERQRRVFNPVVRNTLVGKCATILTPELLTGRSFLDLGACLGASSHWALCQGASRAIAVEIQDSFCTRAESMLKRAEALDCWPSVQGGTTSPRFQVVCSGIREYLAQCEDLSHEVVLAAGLLHCFVDPIQILLDMARVASYAVLIEMVHPDVYLDGHLLDPDEPPTDLDSDRYYHKANGKAGAVSSLQASVRPLQRRIEEAGLLQLAPQALVNMADNDASFSGLAILPSRMAIETTMKNLGFKVSRVFLSEHPTANDDVLTYTGPRKHRALSTRYFLRCVRTNNASIQAAPRSLESLVRLNDKTKPTSWNKAKPWSTFGPSDDAETSAMQVKEHEPRSYDSQTINEDPEKKWEFDATVATRFQREARCHIPDYEEVINDSIHLLEDELSDCLKKRSIKVVDVGCATGHTLLRLHERGFRNIHGVDISVPMIEKAREDLRLAGYDQDSVKLHVSVSPTDFPSSLGAVDEELGAVFVNWTLQFVRLADDRKHFLHNIAKAMKAGALLILTEKTVQDRLTKTAYYDFKRSMGVSKDEIAVKEARLAGVLEPFDVRWYLDALSECGFSDVSLFRAKYGFVTFTARRNAVRRRIERLIPVDKFETWPNLSESANRVRYQAKEKLAPFEMSAWGSSTDSVWAGGPVNGTVYGYIYQGPTTLSVDSSPHGGDRSFTLFDGMYFACPGSVKIIGGCGVLHLVEHHAAMFAIGGPVEGGQGRLPYIDGCTDSLLLSPAVKGAPCLNHLHFPPRVVQTQHTHPSGRSGVVVRGKGTCVCGDGDIRMPLEPGMAFVIPANVLHAFETTDDQELDVIAFHPDSDFGPSFDDHPMINRTIVDGISASQIGSIQTKR